MAVLECFSRPGQIHDDYDALYVPQLDYVTGDLDIHDIALDGDGRVGSIILNCYPDLVALFRASFPMVRQVVSRGTSMPLFDCRAHLMSLGKILGVDEKKLMSTPTPYLTTPAKRINPWAEKIAGDDALQVGIAWKGRDAYRGSPTLPAFRGPNADISGASGSVSYYTAGQAGAAA